MKELSAETRQFIRRILIASGIILFLLVLLYLFGHVFHAFLLIFTAVLFAVFLDGLARWLSEWLPIPRLFSLGMVIVMLVAFITGFVFLAGPSIGGQITLLGERIPQALDQLKSLLAEQSWGQALLAAVPEPEQMVPSFSDILSRLSGVFTTALGALVNVIIILLIGFYLALNPRLYVDSLIRLLPISRRDRGREVFVALGYALHWWLLGRVVAMVAVGVLTSLGLWIIGMPLALALGFIAGLLSFVPYIGPIIAAIPAVLVALADRGLLQVGYVALIYGVVQFLEGYLITPVIQRYAVALPPAVVVIAQFLLGIQFGLYGVLLATPLTVTTILIIQMLYVEDVLGDSVEVLGKHHKLGRNCSVENQ